MLNDIHLIHSLAKSQSLFAAFMLHMPSLTNGWVLRDSNSRPKPCKGLALPAELSTRKNLFMILLRAGLPRGLWPAFTARSRFAGPSGSVPAGPPWLTGARHRS